MKSLKPQYTSSTVRPTCSLASSCCTELPAAEHHDVQLYRGTMMAEWVRGAQVARSAIYIDTLDYARVV